MHGMGENGHEHKNALKTFKSTNRTNTGLAIFRDGTANGNYNVKYTIAREGSDNKKDIAYVNIPLLATDRKIGNGDALERSGVKEGRIEQSKQDYIQDETDELNEEIDVPEDIINSFNLEMSKRSNVIRNINEFKQILFNIIKEKLDNERPNDFPDSHETHAKVIVDKMVDENKGYEQAKEELYNGKEKEEKEEKDENAKVIGENPRGRRDY